MDHGRMVTCLKTLRLFLVIRLCSHRLTFMLMTWKISSIFSTACDRPNLIITVFRLKRLATLDEQSCYLIIDSINGQQKFILYIIIFLLATGQSAGQPAHRPPANRPTRPPGTSGSPPVQSEPDRKHELFNNLNSCKTSAYYKK